MTEERSCNNCGIDLICQECDMGYSNWLPIAQEKKTTEKIQMTEEQAMCLYRMAGDGHVEFIKRLKQAGYICKSALEEAEEEYIAYKEGKNCFVAEIVMDKMYLAIQELRSKNERLKK
jgi:hypothetical protein